VRCGKLLKSFIVGLGQEDADRILPPSVSGIEQRMKIALVIILALIVLGAVGYLTMRSRAPRKRRSQFFSHTFDNSGVGKVPDVGRAHDSDQIKPQIKS
jgi:predicted permease